MTHIIEIAIDAIRRSSFQLFGDIFRTVNDYLVEAQGANDTTLEFRAGETYNGASVHLFGYLADQVTDRPACATYDDRFALL